MRSLMGYGQFSRRYHQHGSGGPCVLGPASASPRTHWHAGIEWSGLSATCIRTLSQTVRGSRRADELPSISEPESRLFAAKSFSLLQKQSADPDLQFPRHARMQ